MKKTAFLILLIGVLISSGCFSDAETVSVSALAVKSTLSMTDKADNPSVVDSTQSVILEFSSALDLNTVSGEVKLYKMKSAGESVEEPSVVTADKNAPNLLSVAKKDGTKFTGGEEYKVVVGNKVKSTAGLTMGKDFTGYFAVNYSLNPASVTIDELNGTRSSIVVISDIHMGANDSYGQFKNNRAALVSFLQKIKESPNVKELVIAGDMLEEWFVPMAEDILNGKTEQDYVKTIAANNSAVIAAINAIITDGRILVTYIPGNHDMTVTADDLQSILPGISQARDAKGAGSYTPANRPEIIIEHGHRYDFYTSPDPISNRSITNTESILPPGFFMTRIGTSGNVEGNPKSGDTLPVIITNSADASQQMIYQYWLTMKTFIGMMIVNEKFSDKVIKTNFDGYTETYAINDIIPYQSAANGVIDVKLFKGIYDNWDARQTANLVSVKTPVAQAITLAGISNPAIDAQAAAQYFKNPDPNASKKRIVVFGHTHGARITPNSNLKLQKTIYANTGTWIDNANGSPTMTFVMIVPQKTADSAVEYVNLYQYSSNGGITKIADPQAITNINQ